jgi:hypothetical protein
MVILPLSDSPRSRRPAQQIWTKAGATSVLSLRVALKSNRWDECWDRLNDSDYLTVKLAAGTEVALRPYTLPEKAD